MQRPTRLESNRAETETNSRESGEFESAAHSDELCYLNERYAFGSSPNGSSYLDKLRARLRNWLFADYISEDIQFRAKLVRHLNEMGARMDRALLRLADRRDGDVNAVENRIGSELQTLRQTMDSREGRTLAADEEVRSKLQTLDSVVKGLEHIVSQARAPGSGGNAYAENSAKESVDYRYLLLENRFRGSEEEISLRLREYVEVFSTATGPVFELGAGRGELQRLLRDAGIESYGYELDEAMCERGRSLSLDLRLGDGIEHLRQLTPESLGGFAAIQVVEHLPVPALEELLSLLRAKLRSGSKILLETINSESLLALARNYFRDPTHVAPLHPETLRYLVESAGMRVLEIRYRSPFPEGAKLQLLSEDQILGPRAKETVRCLNRNIAQLNDILFGSQDYALVAQRS